MYLHCTLVMIQFYIQRLKPSVSLDDVLTDIRFRDLFLLFDEFFCVLLVSPNLAVIPLKMQKAQDIVCLSY